MGRIRSGDDLRIEPCQGATYHRPGKVAVYAYGAYPRSSVLYGRTRRTWVEEFDSVAEAQAAFPTAVVAAGSGYVEDRLLDLPDEDGHTYTPDAGG